MRISAASRKISPAMMSAEMKYFPRSYSSPTRSMPSRHPSMRACGSSPASRRWAAALVHLHDELGQIGLARRRLDAGDDPQALMDECREGMERVGELYERGKYFISALIMAGEIFREAAEILIPRLEVPPRPQNSGTIVIATVKGDIHDIGKNIVITLLDAHGFAVVDLGVDVTPHRIADAVVAEHPDVLGLSCLLTTGFESMRQTIDVVRERTASIVCRMLSKPVVSRHESPRTSGCSATTASAMRSGVTSTPRSTTAKPCASSSVMTIFLPMSWMSPFTVAITMVPEF